nr:probable beta-D-xylosidase 7 [Ipomoea batatas]
MRLHGFAAVFWVALLLISAHSAPPPFSCDPSDPQTKTFGFCKPDLSIRLRVRDLVSRLTLDEKISQLVNSAAAIPRLGIPAYNWWSEALHGVANAGQGISLSGPISGATSFPQVILTAASFDQDLWYRIGQVIGKEARAVYNGGQASGLTFWAPNINIFRDPRWGRGQETPGEDPTTTGKYAVAFVRGVQGDSFQGGRIGNHLQASACCKHFTAYDLENWNGVRRYGFNAIVTKQDMSDTFQPPFQECVQKARASGIMCAYNSVNGIPSCADQNLLTNVARREWGFHGYITSDCDAVSNVFQDHKYTKTPEDTVAAVLNAGMDVNCGQYLAKYTKSAVEKKKVSEDQIDRALHNLFGIRMRLGLFSGDPKNLSYGGIGPDQVCSQDHQNVALEAARKGIVLLKNSAKLLPLSKTKTASLAVIGPNANTANVLQGNYYGPGCKSVEILKALQGYAKYASFHPGCNAVNCTSAAIGEAVELAKKADQVVLVMGLDQTQEREDVDRVDLLLPGQQESLITSVAEAAKKPVILVLLSGGPVDVTFAKSNPKIGSILWAGYPGEAGGLALAEVIFGDYNPGGKLPVTWYPKDYIKIPMTDMRMRADQSSGYPGRTYRFYTGPKVFEFGYGLSYTKYSYEFTSVTSTTINLNQLATVKRTEGLDSVHYISVEEIGEETCENAKFSAIVGVQNSEEMDGTHPVLLFIKPAKGREGNPLKQLVGFQSVNLKAGERTEVQFEISPCHHLSSANKDGLMMIEEGSSLLVVGNTEHAIDIVI